MLRLYDPNKYERPKPWIIPCVLEDNDSPKRLGLTCEQWLLNAVLWAGILAVALVIYVLLK